KLAFASNIRAEHIISAPDVANIYDIPLNFEKDGLSETLLALLKLTPRKKNLNDWRAMINRLVKATTPVRIGIVGKYFKTGDFMLADVYLSVIEALKHAAGAREKRLTIEWLDASDYETEASRLDELTEYDGLLVPGGFGERGVEGKIKVIGQARQSGLPYFGLCYGLQLAVVEYARQVLGFREAHTTEIDPTTKHPVIDLLPEQKEKLADKLYGATMRLGAYPAKLRAGTIAASAYGATRISERHRHRYEVNPEYVAKLEAGGMIFSGRSPDGRLMEIAELPTSVHPFFLGTQFHPEFKSRPLAPHPLFLAFIRAASARVKETK
ncbi:MAG: CTP synthase, partial [Patescibacteria group bacterium]